jgi:hypothetical protein
MRWVIVALLAACGGRDEAPPPPVVGSGTGSAEEPSPHDRELMALWDFEKQRRAAIDFATHPASDQVLGADPYRIARAGKHVVGLLRGESVIVLLDGEAQELARAAAPASPTGVAVTRDGAVLVVGEGAREIAQYKIAGTTLARVATIPVDTLGMRGIAVSPDGKTAYVVEERQGRLLAVTLANRRVTELGRCHGPIGVEAIADVIVTNCLLDRALEIRRGNSLTKIQHDGPLWGFDLLREGNGKLLLAAGGVEDHPLERADGGFGYIDSYVYLYRLDAKPERLAAINASEQGVITPKAIELFEDGDLLGIATAGYGGGKQAIYSWPTRAYDQPPDVNAWAAPPGAAAAVFTETGAWVTANPLLDAWVIHRASEAVVVPAGKPSARSRESRIGELLFFTEMMAPWSDTAGKRSRFTCETCHHEGYIDGRTHFTGREHGGLKVHAATRPLLGLFNNAPYFSRALDQTMTQMVHSEFKVANRHNGRDPWFELSTTDLEWLGKVVGSAPERFSAEDLRRAFIAFLIEFTHRRNPAADHAAFTPIEKRGAEVFRDRCASCHAARLIAEEPTSELAFERWEKLVLSPAGPIVWNNAAYAKTGVLPYVHDDGARVPTLRRLYKKWPYFTNGTAKSLADVLARFSYDAKTSLHDGGGTTKLTADEQAALLAFLDLL